MKDLGRNTFALEDMDQQFWEKAVLIYKDETHLSVLTADKVEYYIGLENLGFEVDCLTVLLRRENDRFTAEEQGWSYLNEQNVLIRDEYVSDFGDAWAYEHDKENWDRWQDVSLYMQVLKVAGKMLGLDTIPEQTVWEENVNSWNERKNSTYFADLLEAKKLKPEDLDWQPYYVNNIAENGEDGKYAMIFKEDGEKITGCKFTIEYDRDFDFFALENDDVREITGYNLWVKHYHDILGPLHQPEYGKRAVSALGEDDFESDCTFHEYELNDKGWTGVSHSSIESAKAAALDLAMCNGYTRENLIRDIDNPARECKGWMRYYGAMAEFQDRYEEIMKVVYEFEYPNEGSYGGGFIISALEEQLGIERERAELMLKHIPMILTKREQRKAHEKLARCKEVLNK